MPLPRSGSTIGRPATARVSGSAAFSATLPGAAQPTWKPSWFPAFCRGWDTYAVECRQARADVGRVYDPAWEPPSGAGPPRFRNLEHLVASAIRRFEAGGYTWNPATRFLDERTEVLRPLYEREIAEARA